MVFYNKGGNSLVHTGTPLVSKKEGRRDGGALFWLTLRGGVRSKVTKTFCPRRRTPVYSCVWRCWFILTLGGGVSQP